MVTENMVTDMDMETVKPLISQQMTYPFGVDDIFDPLGGMPTHRVELVRSMSSIKIYMLSGSISSHFSSQGIWVIGLGAVALYGAHTRSRMNIIRSWINILGGDEDEEEEKGTATLAATALEV